MSFKRSGHQLAFEGFNETNIRENDLLVPLSIPDLKYLNEQREMIKNNPLPIPSLEAIAICDDKFLFDRTLRKKGFGKYLPRINGEIPYPYILKKSISGDGTDCYIISDQEMENKLKHLIGQPDYFCQQIIEGTTEYATHILLKDNRILAALNIKYVFDGQIAIKGQNDFIYRKICSCPYLDLFADMLRAIEFEGLCCLNYKVLDGQPYILEINPRFGGSLSAFFVSFVRRLDLDKKAVS